MVERIVLAFAHFATIAAVLHAADPLDQVSVSTGRDALLLQCNDCVDGDIAPLQSAGVSLKSQAVFAGAFLLSWEGQEEVSSGVK